MDKDSLFLMKNYSEHRVLFVVFLSCCQTKIMLRIASFSHLLKIYDHNIYYDLNPILLELNKKFYKKVLEKILIGVRFLQKKKVYL